MVKIPFKQTQNAALQRGPQYVNILDLAHTSDTLNTVVRRTIQVAKSLNQKHVVLAVGPALFPLLMGTARVHRHLVPRLGGLHTYLNKLF